MITVRVLCILFSEGEESVPSTTSMDFAGGYAFFGMFKTFSLKIFLEKHFPELRARKAEVIMQKVQSLDGKKLDSQGRKY